MSEPLTNSYIHGHSGPIKERSTHTLQSTAGTEVTVVYMQVNLHASNDDAEL